MKTTKIIILVLAAMVFGACSDSFLTTYPNGGTLTEEQFEKQIDALEGTALSVYPMLYSWSGDGHDEFGERAIDMYGDLLCGDMALNTENYGWFSTDAKGMSRAYRAGYIWSHYYNMIRLCNLAINAVDNQGVPQIPETDTEELSDSDIKKGFYYGQFLTLRAFCYSKLMEFYIETPDEVTYATELAIPIYDEVYTQTDLAVGMPRATANEVYQKIEQDLVAAIDYLDGFEPYITRTSKLEMDADVARTFLAYAYLNWGDHDEKAYEYAKEVIDRANFTILPNNEVLTNGFNDVSTDCWMWGQEVTMDNYTALPSFFGQVDVYTYSYASAGDIKGVDDALLAEMTKMKWDIREEWFAPAGTKNAAYAPWKKFFSATSTTFQGDREWLSDNVFMRYELPHLIAAEAAWKKGDLTNSLIYLDAIMSQRLKSNENAKTQYEAYKSTLTSSTALKDAILYNWRVEMWGEGYGLQTFRRLHKNKTLGTNQFRSGQQLISSEYTFTFNIPSSEYTYNQAFDGADTEYEQAD